MRLSVRSSFRPLRLWKYRVSWPILAMIRSFAESHDWQNCYESLLCYSVVSSVCSRICLSIYVTYQAPNSTHAATRFGRIVTRLGLFFVERIFLPRGDKLNTKRQCDRFISHNPILDSGHLIKNWSLLGFVLLLQPKCLLNPFHHCSCQFARNWGSSISGPYGQYQTQTDGWKWTLLYF